MSSASKIRGNAFKRWTTLAKPSKKYFAISFLAVCTTSIFYVLEPIALANVITAITSAQYDQAMLWVIAGFVFVLGRNLAWHLNYWVFARFVGHTYNHVNNLIFRKILSAKSENFKRTSVEKIINTVGTDVWTVSQFNDQLAVKLGYFLRVIITVVIVFFSSWIAGLIILFISFINYFVVNHISKRSAISNNAIKTSQDNIFEKMTDVYGGRDVIHDFGLTENAEQEYMKRCDIYMKSRHKDTLNLSSLDNIFYAFWQLFVCLTTIYLVWTVSQGALALVVYFIIVGYLAPTIERVNNVYFIFKDLKIADVSVSRINTILNFTDKELIEYGNNLTEKVEGAVAFTLVNAKPKSDLQDDYKEIKNISFSIKKREVALFVGPSNCGKRTIFHILRRAIHHDSGSVTLGGIDIYDFSPKTYISNVTYTTDKPHFFKGTIMDNFTMIEPNNKKKILRVLKYVGLHDYIEKLPEGYDTNVNKLERMPQKERYLFGLARAYLTRAEVIMIYEFPTQIPEEQAIELKTLLRQFTRRRTLIIFSANRKLADIATQIISLADGKVVTEERI